MEVANTLDYFDNAKTKSIKSVIINVPMINIFSVSSDRVSRSTPGVNVIKLC
jgi:hypothetical protein